MSLKQQYISCIQGHDPASKASFTHSEWTPAAINSTLDSTAASLNTDGDVPKTTEHKQELIKLLLYEVVRPAFSKSRSKNVTTQGRKAMESWQPAMPYDSEAMQASKPWRYTDAWVVDVLAWCLGQLDTTSVEEHWPMVIPAILAQIDDDDTACRVRGCELLQVLLNVTPTSLLTRTGMGEVFEQALLPHLVHVPPAFEEDESLTLLSATYPALLKLVQVRFPEKDERIPGKQKSLDRVLRQGVFSCLSHLGDNVAVSRLLLQQLGPLLTELGMLCVKHLKVMVPLVSERLTNPFATAAPALMMDAAVALKMIMLNAWPRVPNWRLEILEAISVAWLRILAESTLSDRLQLVQAELRKNVTILRAIIAKCDSEDADAQVRRMLESDARLSPLLEIWSSPTET